MDQIDIGLRHRIERIVRQIGSQHRSLSMLYADLIESFGKEVPARSSELYGYYADAVLAHFSLEETCLFPACRGLKPEIESEIDALYLEHEFLTDEMRRLKTKVFDEKAADGKRALADFYAAIAEHETREENVVRGILPENSFVLLSPKGPSALSRA